MSITLTSIAATFKDMYPRAGDRIKQYVVDQRRERDWERETCPKVTIAEHDDNTDMPCRNTYVPVPWTYLDHDCCYVCGDEHERLSDRADIQAWRAEKAARPPIEQDRTKLSDEIAEDVAMGEHPTMAMWRKG